jgi:hypothetical protein
MAFEVQTNTVFYGWLNCWRDHDASRGCFLETFNTREDAQAAIDEYISQINGETPAGQPSPGYTREQMRILKFDQ